MALVGNDIFQGDYNSVQRADFVAGNSPAVKLIGFSECFIGVYLDKGIQMSCGIYLVQKVFNSLSAGYSSFAQLRMVLLNGKKLKQKQLPLSMKKIKGEFVVVESGRSLRFIHTVDAVHVVFDLFSNIIFCVVE